MESTTTPRPGVTAEALARMQFCAAALIAPASIMVAGKHIRQAVEAAKVLTDQLTSANIRQMAREQDGAEVIPSDDAWREQVFGDRYPQLVQSAEQLQALSAELFALAEIAGRLATESAFLPDEGPTKWLRENGHANLADAERAA